MYWDLVAEALIVVRSLGERMNEAVLYDSHGREIGRGSGTFVRSKIMGYAL